MGTTTRTVTTQVKYYERTTGSWNYIHSYNETNLVSRITKPALIRRRKPADLFLNGTARQTSSEYQRDGYYTAVRNFWPIRKYEGLSLLYNFPPNTYYRPDPTISRGAMYNKIRSELRGEATNLAMMLAEYRQTAELFKDLALKVAKLSLAVVRRRPDILLPKKQWRRGTASSYLQYTYGVSPLCDDLSSIVSELKSAVERPLYKEGKVVRVNKATHISTLAERAPAALYARSEYHVKRRYRTTYRAYLNKNYLLSSLAAHGFTNPFAIAYELVPFSFVLDWWINAGDVLASLDNLLIIDKLYVLDSEQWSEGEFLTLIGQPNVQGFRYKRIDTRRQPVEISRINTLAYKPSVSVKHILNGTALFEVLRPRSRR